MLPRLLLLLAITIWGWTFVATKIALDHLTPIEILGFRFIIGAPVLYVIMRAKNLRLSFSSAGRKRVALGALIMLGHLWMQAYALKFTSATNTGWLIGVTPLAMAAMAYLVLKEKIGRNTVIGIAIATFGIALLVSKGDLANLDWLSSYGDWLILLTTLTWALYTIIIRDVSRTHNPLPVTLAVIVPGAALTFLYMLFTTDWSKMVLLPIEVIVALLFLGALGTAVALWIWQYGVAKLGAARAGMFLYLEPLATTALAVPYLHEHFGWAGALGGALLLAGVYIGERKKNLGSRPDD